MAFKQNKMKIIYLKLILIGLVLTGCGTKKNYSFNEVVEYSAKLNLPSEKLYFIDADSLKTFFSGEKLSLQNHGIKVMDSELNVLKTKEGSCSIKKLKDVSELDSLKVDSDENNKFIKIYPNLSSILKKKKYTVLCIWSKFYPKNVTLENINLALETSNKYKNCQIVYLNADIYSELNLKN